LNQVTATTATVATVRALHQARPAEALLPAAPQANDTKSCKDVPCTGSTSRIPPPANHDNNRVVHLTPPNSWVHMAWICGEGFIAVVTRIEINLAILPC
jgi:hypothetical protein